MRILLCGGGTAGHVMPAVAMAEIIEKSFPECIIAFAGRKGGKENDAYKRTGHQLYEIDIQGISRSLTPNNIKTIFKLIKSSRIAERIISDFNPDIIIGTGGYVCFPFVRIGQRKNIKTVLHESNASPGLVTKLLSKRCDKVLLNLEDTKQYLKRRNNVEVVGNPTRHSFNTITKTEAKKALGVQSEQILIVSFGGSLGSEVLNENICEFIDRYVVNNRNIIHIHSTGRSKYDEVISKFPQLAKGRNTRIVPYIDDMPTVLTAADIAITRSGAITISELCHSKTPSVLVPSPNVTANHQLINALHMQKWGAAILIEEKDLTPNRINDVISELIKNTSKLKSMSNNAYKLYNKNTEEIIQNSIKSMLDDK